MWAGGKRCHDAMLKLVEMDSSEFRRMARQVRFMSNEMKGLIWTQGWRPLDCES